MEIKVTYRYFFKPTGDFLLAVSLLILLSPVLLLISLILLLHGQPVVFCHTRPGYNARLFTVYKFTTMCGKDQPVAFPFGKFLRRTSLDELPQLVNVLKGEMSFIGPRPLLVEYLNEYTDEQATRHQVKPGITGWAQVHGRNVLSFRRKMELDVFYSQHLSFALDLLILVKTLSQLFRWKEADFHEVILEPKRLGGIG